MILYDGRVITLREEDAARARGEHIPTTAEKFAAFIAAMHRVQAAMRDWRIELEEQRERSSERP